MAGGRRGAPSSSAAAIASALTARFSTVRPRGSRHWMTTVGAPSLQVTGSASDSDSASGPIPEE
jgi:hypothetical protein